MTRRRRSAAGAAVAGAVVAAVLLAGCAGSGGPQRNAAQQAADAQQQSAARALARGDAAAALAAYSRALALAESVEDYPLAGTVLLNLALVHARLGQDAAAKQRLDRIVASPRLYTGPLQSQAAARQALLALDRRDPDAALRWADSAAAACASPCPLAAMLANLRAGIALDRGDADDAARMAEAGAAIAGSAGQDAEQANGLRLAGRAHTAAGRVERADERLAQALAIDRRLGLPERIALDLLASADNETRRGDAAASRSYLERALRVAEAAGDRAAAATIRARIAR